MATATPSARRGPRRRRSKTPDRSSWTRSHPRPASILRESAARKSLPRCGELTFRTPGRHRAPNQQPGRLLIPGDGAAGDQEAQNRPVYATPAARPVSATSWRYDLRRTRRLVNGKSQRPRSTWPDQARLPLLTVTHRYKRAHCLRLEQFQSADFVRISRSSHLNELAHRSAIPGQASHQANALSRRERMPGQVRTASMALSAGRRSGCSWA
jgi:hypothetical protein